MAAAMKGVALMLAMVVFAAIAASVSAQEPAPAPAPSLDKGAAAYSMGVPGAVIFSSLFMSMLAFLKH